MMASALREEPNRTPPCGTPPMAPPSTGQGNRIGDSFFTGNGGNVFRSADAEVDDGVFSQFQSAAATDDFLGTHGEYFISSAFRGTVFTA